jgi:DNA-binding MarR family transcriptional regulator
MTELPQNLIEMRDNNIGRLFQRAARAYSERALTLLHEKGFDDITLFHTALIANLAIEGSQITEIAEKAGMTKQAMGQLANELEAKGYVLKERDPEDKRALKVSFTLKGKEALEAAYQVKLMIEAEYSQKLGGQNNQMLRQLLENLLQS